MHSRDEIWNPAHEFSLMPFWFWNDALREEELARQMAEMQDKGVHGFVIHPRVGLPRDIGWMSARMLHFVRFAVEEAARRGMYVVLYDEGMYPSGSSSGQVVQRNPAHQCRCLARIELAGEAAPPLPAGHNIVAVVPRANGQRIAVVDRPVDAFIRGLHYIGDGPAEDEPPAGDILNPEAVASFIELVYDKYAATVGDYFGSTVLGIFTDEPGLLGRCRERDVRPGTTGILTHVNAYLGYDFTPHLPALWYDDEPDAAYYRAVYRRAVNKRLEETYYRPLYEWCEAHGIALTGHPADSDDIGMERYFHIPGQDIVWRWVLPNHPSALEGAHATQVKCSSSAMIHLGRRRNSNECFGAYGHGFTWEEMKWLTDWCFVRGVNLLYPHAFYYSIRGPRRDERPPDVGPHSPWWDRYQIFADYCRRLSWVNTDGTHVCHVAILGESDYLPWEAAKVCYQQQRDFNYLEMRHLWEDAIVDGDGIRLAGMHYAVLVVDGIARFPATAVEPLQRLARAGRLVLWGELPPMLDGAVRVHTPQALVAAIDRCAPPDLTLSPPHPDIRYRHQIKNGTHYYLICNEGMSPVETMVAVSVAGKRAWLDLFAGTEEEIAGAATLTLLPYTLMVLRVVPEKG